MMEIFINKKTYKKPLQGFGQFKTELTNYISVNCIKPKETNEEFLKDKFLFEITDVEELADLLNQFILMSPDNVRNEVVYYLVDKSVLDMQVEQDMPDYDANNPITYRDYLFSVLPYADNETNVYVSGVHSIDPNNNISGVPVEVFHAFFQRFFDNNNMFFAHELKLPTNEAII